MKKFTYKRGLDLANNNKIRIDRSDKRQHLLKQRHTDNPFWINGDRHLCPECRTNTHVRETDENCSWCGVKFVWL